jgi:hypothetical protein
LDSGFYACIHVITSLLVSILPVMSGGVERNVIGVLLITPFGKVGVKKIFAFVCNGFEEFPDNDLYGGDSCSRSPG